MNSRNLERTPHEGIKQNDCTEYKPCMPGGVQVSADLMGLGESKIESSSPQLPSFIIWQHRSQHPDEEAQ